LNVRSKKPQREYGAAVVLGIFLAVFGSAAYGMYALMQPTVVTNQGMSAHKAPPKTVVDYNMSAAVAAATERLATLPAPPPLPEPEAVAAPEPKKETKSREARQQQPAPRRERTAQERQYQERQYQERQYQQGWSARPYDAFAQSRSYGGSRPWF
jgi:type IV secretory pathway VirB10-like protein